MRRKIVGGRTGGGGYHNTVTNQLLQPNKPIDADFDLCALMGLAQEGNLVDRQRVDGSIQARFRCHAQGADLLDVGSGAGDVALLLSELVGPRGRVVGVDTNEHILETARARVEAVGARGVTFHAGDVRTMALDDDFDAVVGRWILMYIPDPAAFLKMLATRVRPGGIVAFHENDFHFPPATFPPIDEVSRLAGSGG